MSSESPEHLFKFVSADSAKSILESQSLRWSAPDLFNDPFEMSSQTPLSFETDTLLDSTIKLASSMIFAPETPKGESPLINAIRRWRDEDRFSDPEEAHQVLRELLSKMVDYRLDQLQSGMAKWQRYVRNVRLCCFCKHADNMAGWRLFAHKHQGVALRFNVGTNSSFPPPKPVVYQTDRPELTTLREQLGAILHNRKDGIVDRFADHFFVKSRELKPEDEWRCIKNSQTETPISDENFENWFDNIKFKKEDLGAIYFGVNISDDNKTAISNMATNLYQNIKLFQAVRAKTGFALEFEKIPANANK